jgi:hypothetical protein
MKCDYRNIKEPPNKQLIISGGYVSTKDNLHKVISDNNL